MINEGKMFSSRTRSCLRRIRNTRGRDLYNMSKRKLARYPFSASRQSVTTNMRFRFQVLVIFWIVKNCFIGLSLQLNSNGHEIASSYFYYRQPEYPRDCKEVFDQCVAQNSSSIYFIKPDGYEEPFEIYCENTADERGWTVIQRQSFDNVDFERNWAEYKNGFGFLNNNFWLGNEKISFLTNQRDYQLRIEMENEAGRSFHVSYNLFRISDEWSDYMLVSLGQFGGTAGSFITWFPANMVYGNCTCQKTCEDPDGRNECHDTRDELEMCFCPEGFFIKGQQCVRAEECACFQPGDGVITSSGYSYNADCSRRCSCEAGVVTCEDNVMCDVNAVCEERDNIRQCYCNEEDLGDGNSCTGPMTDCQDVFSAGYTDSGVYTIKPRDWLGSPFEVYCNMTGGRGWTVFQRRVDGSEDFYQNWNIYRQGFGSPVNELWLGNEKLYFLTKQKRYQLWIDITLNDGTLYHLEYDSFTVGDESSKYQLTLGTYSGNAGFDYMTNHRDRGFTTFDSDNDGWGGYSCALYYHGGWWYGNCYHANLNGHYVSTMCLYRYDGGTFHYDCQLQYVQMKIRPV